MTRVAVDANFNEVPLGSPDAVQEFKDNDPAYTRRRAAVDSPAAAVKAEPEAEEPIEPEPQHGRRQTPPAKETAK